MEMKNLKLHQISYEIEKAFISTEIPCCELNKIKSRRS